MLLLVSGASGVGKSTTRRLLTDRLADRGTDRVEAVELAHLTPVPAVPTVEWRQRTAELAVRRALELADDGRHLLLAGDPVVPAEVVAAPSARQVDVALCLLDADAASQTARLRGRGEPDDLLPSHLAFAEWLRRHARDPARMLHVVSEPGWAEMRWDRVREVPADDPQWRVEVIDSSGLGRDEVADRAYAWIEGALAGRVECLRAGRTRL